MEITVVGGVNMKKYVKTPPSYIHIYVYIYIQTCWHPIKPSGGVAQASFSGIYIYIFFFLVLRCIHIYTDVYIYTMYI